jgi:hypothetical protein
MTGGSAVRIAYQVFSCFTTSFPPVIDGGLMKVEAKASNMNPYESPIATPRKLPITLWVRILLLALGLLVAAAIMTPAMMDAVRSGPCNISHDESEVAPISGNGESK